jgi:hypothetical protein
VSKQPDHVHVTYIKTTPERLWQALTDGTMTKLTVIHAGFEGETATYHQVTGGWPLIVASLKSLLETGEALSASQPQQASV